MQSLGYSSRCSRKRKQLTCGLHRRSTGRSSRSAASPSGTRPTGSHERVAWTPWTWERRPPHHLHHSQGGVGGGKLLIRLYGIGQRLLWAVLLGKEQVHASHIVLGGCLRRCGDGKVVPVMGGHGRCLSTSLPRIMPRRRISVRAEWAPGKTKLVIGQF